MRNKKLLLYMIGTESMLIFCIAFANINPTPILYFIFYNLLYGLIFSFLVPLYCLRKGKESLVSVGVKRLGTRQFSVLFVFVVFSIGGQLIPKMAAGEQIPWHLLPLGIVPLIMTTFFEEFLFRGFVQSRAEQQFGCLPAILISGAMFSLYHLGYPGFRAWEDLLLLFAVGLGFAAAYRLSGNNLIVSYFVNLPNAFVTYILKYEQFPFMSVSSTIAAAITLVLIGFIILMFRNTNRTMRRYCRRQAEHPGGRRMSYVIQAVLSNPKRPECGQITIPFPIPVDQYDQTIEMVRAADLGFSVNRDCAVDGVDSRYNVLNALTGTLVNIDQLDYLAKRLDGFCSGEVSQFQAMAHKLKLVDIKDFINLTYCCQQATVITDFSDLEAVGRSHFLTVNGGSARMEELENLDGEETAYLLIDGGGEVVTPYGVVYDNGMVLEQEYNGHQLPAYLYDSSLMVLEVTPKRGLAEGDNPEYLYLPASERQIERTLLRVGITAAHNAQVRLDSDELPERAAKVLDLDHLSGDDIPALNRMCQAMQPLSEADMKKLNAVVLVAEPHDAGEVCELAENLDQFDFIPGIHTPEEYGRYMIRESGHFEYDENLEGFYDYRRYGEQHIRQEGGQFTECGYVVYQGAVPLEELMAPAEQSQGAQGFQMGDMA